MAPDQSYITFSLPMTDGAITPLSTPRAGAADALEVAPDGTRPRGPRGYLPLNVAGWLLFGVGMMIVSTDVQPDEVFLAMTPVYILIGFLLSLLLGPVYDRLGVGPASFGRALAISVAASYLAGALWTVTFHAYRHFGAGIISAMLGGPLSLPRERAWWALDGGVINALPLFALSRVRLGLQYNTALREQREQALRAVAAARDAQLRMLAYQLNPHFLFNTLNSIRAVGFPEIGWQGRFRWIVRPGNDVFFVYTHNLVRAGKGSTPSTRSPRRRDEDQLHAPDLIQVEPYLRTFVSERRT